MCPGCCRDVESILKAINLDKQRLDSYSEAMPDDEDEMLEVTFDQLPKGFIRRDFDWSGHTDYTGMQRKVSRVYQPSTGYKAGLGTDALR